LKQQRKSKLSMKKCKRYSGIALGPNGPTTPLISFLQTQFFETTNSSTPAAFQHQRRTGSQKNWLMKGFCRRSYHQQAEARPCMHSNLCLKLSENLRKPVFHRPNPQPPTLSPQPPAHRQSSADPSALPGLCHEPAFLRAHPTGCTAWKDWPGGVTRDGSHSEPSGYMAR
jgi:hypothetical protein